VVADELPGQRLGAAMLGGRYYWLRFEDLCNDPGSALRDVSDRIGLEITPEAMALVKQPATLGRWRDADPGLIHRLESVGRDGLRRFRYVE